MGAGGGEEEAGISPVLRKEPREIGDQFSDAALGTIVP